MDIDCRMYIGGKKSKKAFKAGETAAYSFLFAALFFLTLVLLADCCGEEEMKHQTR